MTKIRKTVDTKLAKSRHKLTGAALAASNEGIGNLTLSDVHFGAGICLNENEYDVRIAADRTIQCFDEFLRFMRYQTNGGVYSTCVIWLPGDIIEGHRDKLVKDAPGALNAEDPSKNAERYAYLIFKQLTRLGEAGVSSIIVLGTPGNHGRKERGEVDFGSTQNYDLDFFWHLKNRCEAYVEDATPYSIEVTFPGCSDEQPVEERIISEQHGLPFILCHGHDTGFELKSKTKTGFLFEKNDVRSAAKKFLDGIVTNYKQRVRERAKQGQKLELDWDASILVHGHWHVSCAAPDERVISCGSLRGLDRYSQGLEAVVALEAPSALCWVVRANGSLSTVQTIEADAMTAAAPMDAPTTPFSLFVWGPSPKVQECRLKRAYG